MPYSHFKERRLRIWKNVSDTKYINEAESKPYNKPFLSPILGPRTHLKERTPGPTLAAPEDVLSHAGALTKAPWSCRRRHKDRFLASLHTIWCCAEGCRKHQEQNLPSKLVKITLKTGKHPEYQQSMSDGEDRNCNRISPVKDLWLGDKECQIKERVVWVLRHMWARGVTWRGVDTVRPWAKLEQNEKRITLQIAVGNVAGSHFKINVYSVVSKRIF